jgi:hypothetical protein
MRSLHDTDADTATTKAGFPRLKLIFSTNPEEDNFLVKSSKIGRDLRFKYEAFSLSILRRRSPYLEGHS